MQRFRLSSTTATSFDTLSRPRPETKNIQTQDIRVSYAHRSTSGSRQALAHFPSYAEQAQLHAQARAQAQSQHSERRRMQSSQPQPQPHSNPNQQSSSQTRRSRSVSAQGTNSHMNQGISPVEYHNNRRDIDPSISIPTSGTSASPRTGRTGTRNGPAPRPATPTPTQNKYGITRTNSGSRKIRGQSADAATPRRNFSETAPADPPRFTPPAPVIPTRTRTPAPIIPAPAPQNRPRVQRSSFVRIIHRIFPNLITHHSHHIPVLHLHSAPHPPPAPRPRPAPRAAPPPPAPIIPSDRRVHRKSLPRQNPISRPPSEIFVPPLPRPRAQSTVKHHVSFVNPHRRKILQMHPLFAASSALDCLVSIGIIEPGATIPPIFYQVTLPPSRVSVRCKPTAPLSPTSKVKTHHVPSHILTEPATEPPFEGTLNLASERFPWTIVVHGGCAVEWENSNSRISSSTETRGRRSRSASAGATARNRTVTNNDILYALYHTLNLLVTEDEWNALRTPLHPAEADLLARLGLSQSRVQNACRERTRRVGAEQGIRRVDWLMGQTKLVGIVVDQTASGSLEGVEGKGMLIFDQV